MIKKIIPYILIIVVLVGVFNTTNAQSPTKPCLLPDKTTVTLSQADCLLANGTWGSQTTTDDKNYHYLAPLPGIGENFDPTQPGNLGTYLNIMINLFIGICAVLAVIMIVMGGLEYMTSELISSKEHGKERINSAIFGLILALGAWTILYTINPDLLNTEFSSLKNVEVVITLDDALFAETEESVSTAGTSYKLKGSRTAGISNFLNTGGCSSLNKITVDTKTNKANFCGGTNCVSIPVGFGKNGIAEVGQGKSGDGKTPKGTYTTDSDRRIASGGVAAQSRNGYNLGAAFINIGVILNGSNRGIGFHGSASGNMGTTNGCVRMTNDDLAALAPCIKTGTTVVIQ